MANMIKRINEYLTIIPESLTYDQVQELLLECQAEIEHLVSSLDDIRNVPLWDEYRCIEIANEALKDYNVR